MAPGTQTCSRARLAESLCPHKPSWAPVSAVSLKHTPGFTILFKIVQGLIKGKTPVQDEGLKRLLMSWYYAGYYTGLYEGQQRQS